MEISFRCPVCGSDIDSYEKDTQKEFFEYKDFDNFYCTNLKNGKSHYRFAVANDILYHKIYTNSFYEVNVVYRYSDLDLGKTKISFREPGKIYYLDEKTEISFDYDIVIDNDIDQKIQNCLRNWELLQ